jgi:hypothetical protein
LSGAISLTLAALLRAGLFGLARVSCLRLLLAGTALVWLARSVRLPILVLSVGLALPRARLASALPLLSLALLRLLSLALLARLVSALTLGGLL